MEMDTGLVHVENVDLSLLSLKLFTLDFLYGVQNAAVVKITRKKAFTRYKANQFVISGLINSIERLKGPHGTKPKEKKLI